MQSFLTNVNALKYILACIKENYRDLKLYIKAMTVDEFYITIHDRRSKIKTEN